MDSLTQAALGSSVALALVGKKFGATRAIFFGAILGTLPDLDVIAGFWQDEIESIVEHRGFTHSFFYQFLFSLICAWLSRFLPKLRLSFARVFSTLFLILFTHAIIDLFTVYGTRVFTPFSSQARAIASVFIIDPIYTLCLVFGLISAFLFRKNISKALRTNSFALIASTLYLVFSLFAQQFAKIKITNALHEQKIEYQKLLCQATPFNTLLWRTIAITDETYFETYFSLLAPHQKITVKKYPRHRELEENWRGHKNFTKLTVFSRGYYAFVSKNDRQIYRDLRFGFEEFYPFSFELNTKINQYNTRKSGEITQSRSALGDEKIFDAKKILHELYLRMLGKR